MARSVFAARSRVFGPVLLVHWSGKGCVAGAAYVVSIGVVVYWIDRGRGRGRASWSCVDSER